ncbi:MAG: hypothetical protein AAGB24_13195 [Bacteroidota bacterium]
MKNIAVVFALTTCLLSLAQKGQGTIYFKNGTKKTGLVKYGPKLTATNMRTTDKVLYKTHKKDKNPIEYDFFEIFKIEYAFGTSTLTYYFKIPEENPNIVLDVSLLYEGNVNLYRHSSLVTSTTPNGGTATGYTHNYYVQKNEKQVSRIFPNRFMGPSSQKLMKQYFSDCPKLVELIARDAFKMYVANTPKLAKNKTANRLIEIAKYYDSNCSAAK